MIDEQTALRSGVVLQGKAYKYRIIKALGQGAFGIAYQAEMTYNVQREDGSLGERTMMVALKEFFIRKLHGRKGTLVISNGNNDTIQYFRREFEREPVNLKRAEHPNVASIYEEFEANHTLYYSMEYFSHGSLDEKILACGRLDENDALRYIEGIAFGLIGIHDSKVLHLDLKPVNIMLDNQDEPVIIDFGLSKHYDEEGNPESGFEVSVGTTGYSPVEQLQRKDISGFPVTIDIYALGGTLFKMVTGMRPPKAEDIASEGFPIEMFNSLNISEKTIRLIKKAMAPNPSDRYSDAWSFINDCCDIPEFESVRYNDALEYENKAENAYRAKDYTTAMSLSLKAFSLDRWRTGAIRLIAGMYEDGFGVPKDYQKAAYWYLQAARSIDIEAANDLGELFGSGDYGITDLFYSVKWLRYAAKHRHARSQMELAEGYYLGKGCPQNLEESFRWYVEAGRNGNYIANYCAGMMCEQGLGTEKDYEQAAIWYRRNADEYESIAERDQMRETTKLLMIPESFFSLGCLYYFGRGMEQNYSTALYWFTKAAYYDHANAQYNIGCMYDYGEGVPQDERKAFQWFQRAANNGSMDAKYNLGVYYELGKGLDRPDVKKAIELYQEASSLGHQGAMQCLQRLGATAKTKKIISSPKGKDGVGIFSRVKSLFKKNDPPTTVVKQEIDEEQTLFIDEEEIL